MGEKLFARFGNQPAAEGYKFFFDSGLHFDIGIYQPRDNNSTWKIINGGEERLEPGSMYVAAHFEFSSQMGLLLPRDDEKIGIRSTRYLQQVIKIVGNDYLKMINMMSDHGKLWEAKFVVGGTNPEMARFAVKRLGFKYVRTLSDNRSREEIVNDRDGVIIVGLKEDLLRDRDSVRETIQSILRQ